jgi:hypothetical protein
MLHSVLAVFAKHKQQGVVAVKKLKNMRVLLYLLYINLSRLLQPFIKRADDGDFFRCLKPVCVTSRSSGRG